VVSAFSALAEGVFAGLSGLSGVAVYHNPDHPPESVCPDSAGDTARRSGIVAQVAVVPLDLDSTGHCTDMGLDNSDFGIDLDSNSVDHSLNRSLRNHRDNYTGLDTHCTVVAVVAAAAEVAFAAAGEVLAIVDQFADHTDVAVEAAAGAGSDEARGDSLWWPSLWFRGSMDRRD